VLGVIEQLLNSATLNMTANDRNENRASGATNVNKPIAFSTNTTRRLADSNTSENWNCPG